MTKLVKKIIRLMEFKIRMCKEKKQQTKMLIRKKLQDNATFLLLSRSTVDKYRSPVNINFCKNCVITRFLSKIYDMDHIHT